MDEGALQWFAEGLHDAIDVGDVMSSLWISSGFVAFLPLCVGAAGPVRDAKMYKVHPSTTGTTESVRGRPTVASAGLHAA